jgi:DnaJ-class molecular chaperone
VKHAAQREGEYLSTVTGGGRVTGMGIAPVSEAKAKSKTTTCADCKGEGTDDDGEDCDTCNGTGKVVMDDASESARGTRIGKTELREAESIFSRLTNGNTNAAKAAVQKGVAA